MKIVVSIAMAALMLTVQPVIAAEARNQAATDSGRKSQTKPEKKSSGTMDEAGNSMKSGWSKFTRSVKQGRTKPACTPEQKSLKQCQ